MSTELSTGRVTVKPDPRREIDLARVPTAIRRSGFDPGEMTIVARGSIEAEERGTLFRIRHWRQAYVIRGVDPTARDELDVRARVDWSGESPILVVGTPARPPRESGRHPAGG